MKPKDNKQRKLIKWLHRLKNLGSRLFDPGFNSFERYEYTMVPTEKLNDLDKLRYVRDLELAKSGFVNISLKAQMALLKRENHLYRKDLGITPIGRISLYESGGILGNFLLGYNERDQKIHISHQKVNNCPVWNPFRQKLIVKMARNMYPLKADFLYLKNRFFERDVKHMETPTQLKLRHTFNTIMQAIYAHNPHLKRGIQEITPQGSGSLDLSNVRPIQLKAGAQGLYVPSHIGKNYVVLVPYLEAVDKGNRQYLSISGFRTLLNEKAITPFSETKYGVDLGTCGDQLHIKVRDTSLKAPSLQKWVSLDDFLQSPNTPAKMKYEVTHFLIGKKDFLVDLAKIPLIGTDSTLVVKRHYGSNGNYYALQRPGNNPGARDYRPMDHLRKEHADIYEMYREHLNIPINENKVKHTAPDQKIRL